MESTNKSISKLILIETILITILLILVIILDFQNKKMTKKLNNYPELENVDIKNIISEIEKYQNIDENTRKLLDEYYTNINKLEQKILADETNVKIAYLTFDDGPYELTKQYLDILKQNNIRATFFVLGKEGYEETYKRIVQEGHTLANHTFYHNIRTGLYESTESFISQVTKLEQYLYDITGVKTSIVRMPGGSSTPGSLKGDIINELHNHGYNYIDWNCETGDGSSTKLKEKSTMEWFYQTKKNQKIIVLLMHDYNEQTLNNLQNIIDNLKNENYIFLPLNNKSIMVK